MNGIELIKTRVNDNNEVIVSARELYDFLEIKTKYTMWFDRMSEYGFEEGQDFIPFLGESNGGRPSVDHAIKLDMAKEIAMIQRSDKGKQARKYFLDVEKAWNSPEKIMERALQIAKQRAEEAERKIFEAKPKILLAESIENSKDLILVRDLAVILKQNGVDIGQNRLYERLRDLGYLIKFGASRNLPTQRSVELGLFRIVESTRNDGKEIKINRVTKVTGKGQKYFVNKFLKENKK